MQYAPRVCTLVLFICSCFVSSLPVFLVTFVIPAAVAIIFNLVVYFIIIFVFIRLKCKKEPPLTDTATTTTSKKKTMKKSRRKAILRLIFSSPTTGILFGLAWIFGALTLITAKASIAFHLLSAFFTATLGWVIFIYYINTGKDFLPPAGQVVSTVTPTT